ncbi:hypothetical protein GW17_00044149 [Ensete ventricosum]|nr:hypothetical protein GW17_00044149 [Ensete ventricosum]
MPSQDKAPMKEADLEPMLMNLKEKDRYVANRDEGLTLVDFGNYARAAVGGGRRDSGVAAGGLLVSPSSGVVGVGPVQVLAVDGAEEIPLQVTAVEAEAAGQFPQLAFAQINFSDRVNAEGSIADLAFEVIINKFLVGVESKESAANRGCNG